MTAFTGKQVKRARTTTPAEYDREHAISFWSRVDMSGDCWLWRGAVAGNGYGVVCWHCEHRPAHRVAYRLTHGEEPAGLEVLHSCDTKLCVRPDHLSAGTHAANMREYGERGHPSLNAATAALWRSRISAAKRQAANPTETVEAES